MDIAIGMPGMIPNVSSKTMKEWAQRAEARGFSSLIVDDRLVWAGYDILISAAAAAAVTERIKITAAVVLGPLRANLAEFAKQVTSIDRISDGRFVLGLGVGSREDDFLASAIDFHSRGKLMDVLLERTQAIWRGEAEPIGPVPVHSGGPPLLFGGSSDATFRRLSRYGTGWVCATSGGPSGVREGAKRARSAWANAGRSGSPRILALTPRFALGPNGQSAVDGYLRAYNAYRGNGANQRAASALVRPELVREQIELFAAAGCDELVINPCDANPDQVDLLADAIAGG
ncbi:MAG TPA: LLM class flavin-dependent oxidoreductase [Acidimicrobiales bacterium]|nr:LLM class flavin-dependent oxidoreductase [Acidimicrobiales bacterium]